MGNQPSQLEREAQSIISRVWDDDPTTKEASINFAKECLERLSYLQNLQSARKHSSARREEIHTETHEILLVLDSYLKRMVGKLYLQCDPRTGDFDHPLLFRFWRYDANKGRYAQTRSGRGLSICTGQPRALHVLRSEPLIQELEMPLPGEAGEVRTSSSSTSTTITTNTVGAGGGQNQAGAIPSNAVFIPGNADTAVSAPPSNAPTPAQHIHPMPTITPANPFAPFSVPTPSHSTGANSQQLQNPSSDAVVLYNPLSCPVHRRVCLVFRGQVIHPFARLRDYPLNGGVLDLVLLRDDDNFHPDLIDDAQVRMLSAHSMISRRAGYIDVLYRLATQSVLAPLREHQDTTSKTLHHSRTTRTASSATKGSGGGSAAHKLLHRLSSQLNLGASYLLPQQNKTTNSIAALAWNILTSLREPRSNARLLVDLFDQASLEHGERLANQNKNSANEVHTGASATHMLEAEEMGEGGITGGTANTLAGRVFSHMRGIGSVEQQSAQTEVTCVVLAGGLPTDLARLIDSFVPNQVQSTVMNV